MTTIFKLIVKSGDEINKTYLLDKNKNTIGRDPKSDIVIDDIEISRNHLEVLIQGEEVLFEDLNSTNGTFLNGKRLEKTAAVSDGDLISIGKNIVLEFIKEETIEDSQFQQNNKLKPSPIHTKEKEQPVENSPIDQTPIEQDLEEQIPFGNDILEQETDFEVDEPQKKHSSKLRKMPTWVLIIIIALAFLLIFCLIPLLVIEVTDQWCNLFAGFFNSMSPGVCP